MGGVEYAVPIGVALLLYFLLPAYFRNRQLRLLERMRDELHSTIIRAGEVRLRGRWFTYPAVMAVTHDYLIIYNVFSLYPDEIPLERLRNLSFHTDLAASSPHPENDTPDISGNILIIGTTEQSYQFEFADSEAANEWKTAIEEAL